jgi:hypothetical protein
MKRREFLPLLLGGSTAFTILGFIQSRPASATFLNDLIDGAMEAAPSSSPSNSPPITAAPTKDYSIFQEIYGENYITREQFSVLQSGKAVHWWDIAPKPYARMTSSDSSERYYFPFAFGEGGAIVVRYDGADLELGNSR